MDQAADLASPVGMLRVTAPPGYALLGAEWGGGGVVARVEPLGDVDHCATCGAPVRRYGRRDVRILEAPSGGVRARMLVGRQRVRCEQCNRLSREPLPNVSGTHRYTDRCAAWMASQFTLRSNVAIGSVIGLDEASVRVFAAENGNVGRWRGAPKESLWSCASCLRLVPGTDVVASHIQDPMPGGRPANAIALCDTCNADVGSRWIVQV